MLMTVHDARKIRSRSFSDTPSALGRALRAAALAAGCCLAAAAWSAPETIRPGEIWPDDRGRHIQAHGGGILKLDLEKEMCLIPAHMEGGAVVHYGGLYYAIGSALTGWSPNPNKYATAASLAGPWSEFKDIAPPETKTYGAQSTMMLKVAGTRTTTVIFMGDIWKPRAQWDSRYLWMPLEIGEGKLRLPEPKEWTLDIETGEVKR
jgi:hypothetical protein